MTGQFIRGIFMMVLATLALAPAAAQPHLEQGVYALPGYALVISEEITPDTLVNFGILVKQNPDLSIVILNSPGGKVYPAMVIAEMIHKHGLSTAVIEGSLCASACSIIFLAGKARLALGDLGVHQISGVSDPSLTQSTISDIYSSLTTFGTHPKVIELMLKTPPDEMYYFSRQELVDYGLNRKVDGAAIGDKTAEQAEIPIIETEMLAHRNFKDWRVAKYLNKKHNLEFITLETISGEPRVGIVTYPVSGRFFIEIYWESAHFTRGSENITIQFRRNDGGRVAKAVEFPWRLAPSM